MSTNNILTNVARPITSATLTIRIVKSFTFRTERSLVIHDVDLVTTTVAQLKEIAKHCKYVCQWSFSPWNNEKVGRCGHSTRLETVPKYWPRYHFSLNNWLMRYLWINSLRRYVKALHQGARSKGKPFLHLNTFGGCFTILFQTSNLIINLDHEDWILTDDGKTLVELGFGGYYYYYFTEWTSVDWLSLVENETEVSFFNYRDYQAFKLDPQVITFRTALQVTD